MIALVFHRSVKGNVTEPSRTDPSKIPSGNKLLMLYLKKMIPKT